MLCVVQVEEACVMGQSLIQGSSTECLCVIEYNKIKQ